MKYLNVYAIGHNSGESAKVNIDGAEWTMFAHELDLLDNKEWLVANAATQIAIRLFALDGAETNKDTMYPSEESLTKAVELVEKMGLCRFKSNHYMGYKFFPHARENDLKSLVALRDSLNSEIEQLTKEIGSESA